MPRAILHVPAVWLNRLNTSKGILFCALLKPKIWISIQLLFIWLSFSPNSERENSTFTYNWMLANLTSEYSHDARHCCLKSLRRACASPGHKWSYVPPACVMASICCHCCYSIYILQSECVGLIRANKPRWVWLASPPNALINAVVWQTAVNVNICTLTSMWQGEVLRAGKQHTAAAGLCTAWCLFECVRMDFASRHPTLLNFDLTGSRCPWINSLLN